MNFVTRLRSDKNVQQLGDKKTQGVVYIDESHSTNTYADSRRRGRITALVMFLMLVVLPGVLGTVYFGFIASDRYVSEAQLTVRQPNGATTDPLSGVLLNFGGGNTSADSYLVKNYILSRGIVEKLENRVQLSSLYQNEDADWLSRLSSEAAREDLYEAYLDYVDVSFDQQSGIVELSVSAFHPDEAKLIADTIVTLSDDMVNRVSEKARGETVRFSEAEALQARNRLEDVRIRIAQYRRLNGELDPEQSALSIGQIIGSLESEISSARAEIASLRSYLDERSPQVIALGARIQALQTQLKEEKLRLAGNSKDDTYATLLDEYERLRMEEQFAFSSYSSLQAANELARSDAARKQLYLVAFVPPSLPDLATEPKRLWLIASTFGLCLLGFGIIMLVIAAIREHARF